MRNITEKFNDLYIPFKGILININQLDPQSDAYVESFDVSPDRTPINFHPLSENESSLFIETLSASILTKPFLHVKGLIPENILQLKLTGAGGAIWYTPPHQQTFDFKAQEIPSGKAWVPPLLWKATRKQLVLYALKDTKRPTLDTRLCYAPFFNIYDTGTVCMGDVEVNVSESASLQEFMKTWQDYFFKSAFTSLLYSLSPVTENIQDVWRKQINEPIKFPVKILRGASLTLKNIVWN